MSAPVLSDDVVRQLQTPAWPERLFTTLGLYGLADRAFQGRVSYLQGRAYLDAAGTSRLWGDRKRTAADAHTVWQADAAKIRQSFLYLHGSDPYCRSAMQCLVDHVVGTGITTQKLVQYRPLPEGPDAGASEAATFNYRTNQYVEDQKKRWMEQADFLGQLHWHDMQAAGFGQLAGEGECLLVERFDPSPGRLLPLCYQLMGLDRLTDFRLSGVQTGHEVVNGIEFDARGRVVAYHLDKGGFRYQVERVPAALVIHHFRRDRIEQHRGISWFAPVIPDIYGLREIKEYSIIARKVQAAIALVIARAPNGGGSAPGTFSQAVAQGSGTQAHTVAHRAIEPGMMHEIPYGASIHSHNPSPTNDLDPLTTLNLRGVGVGLGMSYEFLAGDYSRTNFAGGRLGVQQYRTRTTCIHAGWVRGVERPVDRRFTDVAMAAGVIPRPREVADAYAAYFPQPPWHYDVNPLQTVSAAAARMAAGLSSQRRECLAMGNEPDDVLREIAEEKGQGQQLGLALHQALAQAHDVSDAPA